MTVDDFYKFLGLHEYEIRDLYIEWLESGFERALAPTVDRIDPNGHYEIGNIQIISSRDNSKKVWADNHGVAYGRGYKNCARCKKLRPLTDFNKNKYRNGGLEPYCRTHMNEIKREIRKNNKEKKV